MRDKLLENIKVYFDNKKEVVAVYLFGSYARGKERPLSDIDIGILFDRRCLCSAMEKRNKYIVELSRNLRRDIHFVILNSASEALLSQILLKGRCILANDLKKLSMYKMVILAKIAEFGYHKKQMQSGLIRKITGDRNIG